MRNLVISKNFFVALSILFVLASSPGITTAQAMETKKSTPSPLQMVATSIPPDRLLQEGMSKQISKLLRDGGKNPLLVFFGGGDLAVSLNERVIQEINRSQASILIFDIDEFGMARSEKLFAPRAKKRAFLSMNLDLCDAKGVIDDHKPKRIRSQGGVRDAIEIPLAEQVSGLASEDQAKITKFVQGHSPSRIYFLNYMLISQLPVYLTRALNVDYAPQYPQGKILHGYLLDRHIRRLRPIVQAISDEMKNSDFVIVDTTRRSEVFEKYFSGATPELIPRSVSELIDATKGVEHFRYGNQTEGYEAQMGFLIPIQGERPVAWAPIAQQATQQEILTVLRKLGEAAQQDMIPTQKVSCCERWFCPPPPPTKPESVWFFKKP